MLLYNILLYLCTAILWPVFFFAALASAKRRQTMRHRLWLSQPYPKFQTQKTSSHHHSIWIHALSVGEVLSAIPLTHRLLKQYPEKSVVFTASTLTGYHTAQRHLESTCRILFFPLDFHFSVNRAIAHINPELVVLVETDIWPNFIHEMKKRDIPVFLANARLSRKTLRGYRRFSFFFMPMLLSLSKICVQSETDFNRYQRIGIPDEKLRLTGNLKFDQPITSFSHAKKKALMQSINLTTHHKVIVAGSTHEGEEAILLSIFNELKLSWSNLKLFLAPRDPKRSANIRHLAETMGHVTVALSDLMEASEKPIYDVLVVDVLGVLRDIYAVSDIAFVGGSLVACSGHNPLEPAAYAKPVLFGPDMSDFLDMSKTMLAERGAMTVFNKESLKEAITQLLSDPSHAAAMGRAAHRMFETNKGAVNKTISVIESYLESP